MAIKHQYEALLDVDLCGFQLMINPLASWFPEPALFSVKPAHPAVWSLTLEWIFSEYFS